MSSPAGPLRGVDVRADADGVNYLTVYPNGIEATTTYELPSLTFTRSDKLSRNRPVVLKNGTQISARTKTVNVYDDEAAAALVPGKPAATAQALNLVVEQDTSQVDATGASFDPEVSRKRYDPVVAGDGDGWTLGSPTRVTEAVGTPVESTTLTRLTPKAKPSRPAPPKRSPAPEQHQQHAPPPRPTTPSAPTVPTAPAGTNPNGQAPNAQPPRSVNPAAGEHVSRLGWALVIYFEIGIE